MRQESRILLIWFGLILAVRLLLLLPHRGIEPIAFVNVSVQLLLFVLSLVVARNSFGDQKLVFLNFSIFFGFVVFLLFGGFVGTSFFWDDPYAGFFYYLYVNNFGLGSLFFFVILFLAVDYVLPAMRPARKYFLTAAVTLAVGGALFQPYLFHPYRLYEAESYKHYSVLSAAERELRHPPGKETTDEELARAVMTKAGHDANALSTMTLADARSIVANLRPFLNSTGGTSLFWEPVGRRLIMLRGVAMAILIVLLGLFYRSGRPVGAYVDKIVILFFLFGALEMFHTYASFRSASLDIYKGMHVAGQYVTVVIFVMMIYAFDLKRRFVCSVTGKYYEQAILEAPERITRLRDELDTVILKTFLTDDTSSRGSKLFIKPK